MKTLKPIFVSKGKLLGVVNFLFLSLVLAGCSTLESYQRSSRSGQVAVIPEIKKRPVVKPKISSRTYNVPTAKSKTNGASATKVLTNQEKVLAEEVLKQKTLAKAEVDEDPYSSIPDVSGDSRIRQQTKISVSPAVKSLIITARSDLALGKSQKAISKLERGLRIESENSELWYLLAKSHYSLGNFQQTINMTRKSISYSSDDSLISENYNLMKSAGERSGNSLAIKEALDYLKVNP